MTTTLAGTGFPCVLFVMCSLNTVQPYNIPTLRLFKARSCKPCKEPRNRFPPGQVRPFTTTLFDVPARQATLNWQNRFLGIDSWAPWMFTNSGSGRLREYWISLEDQSFSMSYYLARPPPPPPSPVNKLFSQSSCVSPVELTGGRGGGEGRGRSQFLHKSLKFIPIDSKVHVAAFRVVSCFATWCEKQKVDFGGPFLVYFINKFNY